MNIDGRKANQGSSRYVRAHRGDADDQPDITFFGQALDFKFDVSLSEDREKVDLLVIIGTSLNVAPVSEVGSESSFYL
jgi:NAD-dependent SIR2 family protein deacetylase